MSTPAEPGLGGGWLAAVDRWSTANTWAVDVLAALALAATLGTLTASAGRDLMLARPWPVTVAAAFGVLHASVALRRRAPLVAYALASLAMLVVVAAPNARAGGPAAGPVAVPLVFLPSSLVFLLVLFAVSTRLPRRLSLGALLIALVGVILAMVRVSGTLRSVYPASGWATFYVAAALATTTVAAWSLGRYRLFRRQREQVERETAARRAVLEERTRIARDMHDVVAHSLAVIVRQAEGGAFTATRAPEQAARALRVIADTGRDALADMRGLLAILRDPAGEQDQRDAGEIAASQPTLADLPELLDRVRDAGLEVTWERRGAPRPIGRAGELAAYRVVQEALTNAIKHAGPHARVRLRMAWSAHGLVVDVTDDGGTGDLGEEAVGDDLPEARVPGAGAGLHGLRERVAAVGGAFIAERRDTGFRVRATFPRRGREEGR